MTDEIGKWKMYFFWFAMIEPMTFSMLGEVTNQYATDVYQFNTIGIITRTGLTKG